MDSPGTVVALFLVGLLVVPTAAVGTATTGDGASTTDLQTTFERNELQLTIYENQSARWTFHYERTLDNESERQNFEAFADDFSENETPLYVQFRKDARTLVSEGANETNREMEATDFDRRAYVTNQFGNSIGVVEMSFTWTGFAAPDGQRIIVGDVFEGGLYLGAQQSLVVSPGPNLAFESMSPEGTPSNSTLAESDSITWQGEKEFTDNRPRVVLAPQSSVAGGGSETGSGDGQGSVGDTTQPGDQPKQGSSWLLWAGGLGGIILVAAAATAWYLRDDAGAIGGAGAAPTDRSDDDGGDSAAEVPPEPAVSDDELLTDEDRVIGMLDRNGGRMKQVDIVDETGWSKSKVSMLLSDMEDEGQISKLRVGRENVISLKGREPEATRSPFEDRDDD